MASSYTKQETDKLRDVYLKSPCLETVSKLSVILNRPRKSIISKLVKEGIYVRKGYRTKMGGVPITKLQLVRSIEDALDIKLPDLSKAPKSTLQVLSDTIVDQTMLLEDSLQDLKGASVTLSLQEEIREALK